MEKYLKENLKEKNFEDAKRFGKFSIFKGKETKTTAEKLWLNGEISNEAYFGFISGANL